MVHDRKLLCCNPQGLSKNGLSALTSQTNTTLLMQHEMLYTKRLKFDRSEICYKIMQHYATRWLKLTVAEF